MKIELTHDLIARKVYDMVSVQDRARAHAQHIVRVKYDIYKTSSNVLLSDDELAIVRPHLKSILLNTDEEQFINKSRNSVAWAHKKNIIRNSAIVVMGVALSLTTWGMFERHRANQQAELSQRYGKHLYELSESVRNISNFKELTNAKIASETLLQNKELFNVITGANIAQPLADGGKTNVESEDDSFQNTISPTTKINQASNAALQPCYIQGVVREQGKSDRIIRRANVQVAGINAQTDENGYFSIAVLSNPNFLPDSTQITIMHPEFEPLTYNIALNQVSNSLLEVSPRLRPKIGKPYELPPSQKLLPKKHR